MLLMYSHLMCSLSFADTLMTHPASDCVTFGGIWTQGDHSKETYSE